MMRNFGYAEIPKAPKAVIKRLYNLNSCYDIKSLNNQNFGIQILLIIISAIAQVHWHTLATRKFGEIFLVSQFRESRAGDSWKLLLKYQSIINRFNIFHFIAKRFELDSILGHRLHNRKLPLLPTDDIELQCNPATTTPRGPEQSGLI